MRKYYVISHNYPDNYEFEINFEYIPFVKGMQFPQGVRLYQYKHLDKAEQRITREFLRGNTAEIYETEKTRKKFLEVQNEYAEAF